MADSTQQPLTKIEEGETLQKCTFPFCFACCLLHRCCSGSARTQLLTRLLADTDRDFFMTPEEAKEYGIIDEVIRKCLSPQESPSKSMTNRQEISKSSSNICTPHVQWSSIIISTVTQNTTGNFSQPPVILRLHFHSREREASGKTWKVVAALEAEGGEQANAGVTW